MHETMTLTVSTRQYSHLQICLLSLLDTKQLEDTIHLWAIFIPSIVIHPVPCTWWIFYEHFINMNYFSWMREVTVRRRANKYGGTCACTYLWLSTRLSPKDFTENLYSQSGHRSNTQTLINSPQTTETETQRLLRLLNTHGNRIQCLHNARTSQSRPVHHGWNSE